MRRNHEKVGVRGGGATVDVTFEPRSEREGTKWRSVRQRRKQHVQSP